mmetsp:Transcript_9815/g.12153  ORF Transcript_9815/g.12153 Transcript_9815/m.12153 type:complete len:214 (+) Transcript_9815:559-1200(+)
MSVCCFWLESTSGSGTSVLSSFWFQTFSMAATLLLQKWNQLCIRERFSMLSWVMSSSSSLSRSSRAFCVMLRSSKAILTIWPMLVREQTRPERKWKLVSLSSSSRTKFFIVSRSSSSKASRMVLRTRIPCWWEIEQKVKVRVMKSIVSMIFLRRMSLRQGCSRMGPRLASTLTIARSCSMARMRSMPVLGTTDSDWFLYVLLMSPPRSSIKQL